MHVVYFMIFYVFRLFNSFMLTCCLMSCNNIFISLRIIKPVRRASMNMNCLFQFLIICLYCFLGDLLHLLLPFPIPGSIYGMILLLLSLILGLVRLEKINTIAGFLSKIMPVFFVMPCVSILTIDLSTLTLLPHILFITLTSTVLVMVTTGIVAEKIIRRKNNEK